MSHISYRELRREKVTIWEGEKNVGNLSSLSFHRDTGYVRSIVYGTHRKKHAIHSVHLMRTPRGFELDLHTDKKRGDWFPKEQKVYTKAGIFLGKIHDVYIDDTVMKLSYIEVQRRFLGIKLTGYFISRDAIMSLGKKKVIVRDTIIKEKQEASSSAQVHSTVPVLEMITDTSSEK